MTLVYPLIPANDDNLELRYALRSMQMCMPITRVFIVGHLPKWIRNVTHIPASDIKNPQFKELNIYRKLCEAFKHADSFLYCNDDHFVNKNFNPYVNYYDSTLTDLMNKAGRGYIESVKNTLEVYPAGLNFDIHCPIFLSTYHFSRQFERINMNRPFGYCIKSIYANADCSSFLASETTDIKINKPGYNYEQLNDVPFFSVGDGGYCPDFVKMLENKFPLKSIYEL